MLDSGVIARAGGGEAFERRSPKHIARTTTMSVDGRRDFVYRVVSTDRSIFRRDDPTLAAELEGRPVFAVVDRNVDALYGAAFRSRATECNLTGTFVIDARESTKTLATVEAICAAAYAVGLSRDGVILGIGGGVTLDQAGLAASLFRRGTRFARIPTTLVGIVDVGVGIKQGVNAGGKNAIGTYYPAYVNICDSTFLATLPAGELACGLAEIVKIAIVADTRLFELVEGHGRALLERPHVSNASVREIVVRAQRAMIAELRPNLFEDDRARLADFGHTLSATLEADSGYRVAHGYAVAIDMAVSTAIACELGLCDPATFGRIVRVLRALTLPVRHPAIDGAFVARALEGARRHRGSANYVVPRRIGSAAFLDDVPPHVANAALRRLLDAAA